MNLTEQQQIEAAALQRKHERQAALANVNYPSRKTGEMNKLAKAAKALCEVLQIFDAQASPPALADVYSDTYNETIARLVELTSPQPESAE